MRDWVKDVVYLVLVAVGAILVVVIGELVT